jgi:hypothetical protein
MNTTFSALAPESVEYRVLRGVSVITTGPAKGHGLIVDDQTLAQVVQCAKARAVKVKMLHNSDLSQVVGTLKNFRIEGPKVLADLHLLSSAPARDFVLEIAQTMPTAFGLSISFEGTPDGNLARCSRLLSVDLVDEPAANPDGLFEEKPMDATPADVTTAPEPMTENPEKMEAPTPEDRLAALEAAVGEIKAMLAALTAEESTEAEPAAEMGTPEPAPAPEPAPEEQAGKAFEAVEAKILGAVDTRFEALATLIKSMGAPIAHGATGDSAKPAEISFAELRKSPAAYRAHLIERGILKH